MIVAIGGGPAGYFAAITAKTHAPHIEVVLLEQSSQVLRKVKISGGGRCNVTNQISDPRHLATHYPRGERQLIGAFHRFSTSDMAQWLEQQRVELKTEADGRVFPVSDNSATIVDCLEKAAADLGVKVQRGLGVKDLQKSGAKGFTVFLTDDSQLEASQVVLATGSSGYDLAARLGHTIAPAVPSLFTFKCDDAMLEGLAGVAATKVVLRATGEGLPKKGVQQEGPVLVTHWGLSGPGVLRLSAWGARQLHQCDYKFGLRLDWCPEMSGAQLEQALQSWSAKNAQKKVASSCPVEMPRRLWTALVGRSQIPAERTWAETGRKMQARLLENLKGTSFQIQGKATNKEEFVTCGGVSLGEVDFKTMESKKCPGLYLAGEVLDIDGITGGFNFQNCWTTGFLAGMALAQE